MMLMEILYRMVQIYFRKVGGEKLKKDLIDSHYTENWTIRVFVEAEKIKERKAKDITFVTPERWTSWHQMPCRN